MLSILEWILFLIFINKLLNDISSQFSNYADGTTIYSWLKGKSNQFDRGQADFKNDLQAIVNWRQETVNFNDSNTKILSFNRLGERLLAFYPHS